MNTSTTAIPAAHTPATTKLTGAPARSTSAPAASGGGGVATERGGKTTIWPAVAQVDERERDERHPQPARRRDEREPLADLTEDRRDGRGRSDRRVRTPVQGEAEHECERVDREGLW